MRYIYNTTGTCSRLIDVTLDDNNRIVNVAFVGGCNGNLQGISSLVRGLSAEEAIAKLQGIRCGDKPTSCPDQLAHALAEAIATKA